jgi:hypothetical protein
VQINNIPNATIDTDRFIVSDSGVIKYRTGAELLSDIGGASASGYVPYTGATANLDLGTHTLIAAKGNFSSSGSGDTVGITHSSGSGIALNITKGGNGEGLYINKTSGSGNAATIIGTLNATTLVKSGGTSSEFLKADGSVDSTAYGTGSVTSVGLSSATSGVTIGSTPITTSGTITLAIATASGSQQGLLSSTDWTTFNNKQNALTNPVTGTGTTNYLPKFTGASTIGNSQIFDNGTNVGIGTASPSNKLSVIGAANIRDFLLIDNSQSYFGDNGSIENGTADGNTRIQYFTTKYLSFKQSGFERMRLDASGNLGLGVTPSAWASGIKAIDVNAYASFFGDNDTTFISNNGFLNSSFSWIYKANNLATYYRQQSGQHIWYNAPSGTAGNAISFTQAMTLDASGRLGIGTTSPGRQLEIYAANDAYMKFNGQRAGNNAFTIGNDNSGFIVYDDTNGIYRLKIANSTGAATFSSSVTAQTDIISKNNSANVSYLSFQRFSNTQQFTYLVGNAESSGYLAMHTNDSERVRITSGGNVGIGVTSTSYKLEVAGVVRIQDTLSISNGESGQAIFTNNSTAVSVSTTTALGGSFSMGGNGAFVIVYGASGSNVFIDTIIAGNTGTPTVLSSTIVSGIPSLRTYSTGSNRLQLAMASGTYDVRINILRQT